MDGLVGGLVVDEWIGGWIDEEVGGWMNWWMNWRFDECMNLQGIG